MEEPIQRRLDRREEEFGLPQPPGGSTVGMGSRSFLGNVRDSGSRGFDNAFRLALGFSTGVGIGAQAFCGTPEKVKFTHGAVNIPFFWGFAIGLVILPAMFVARFKRRVIRCLGLGSLLVAFGLTWLALELRG